MQSRVILATNLVFSSLHESMTGHSQSMFSGKEAEKNRIQGSEEGPEYETLYQLPCSAPLARASSRSTGRAFPAAFKLGFSKVQSQANHAI
jgi:hypothetical protein